MSREGSRRTEAEIPDYTLRGARFQLALASPEEGVIFIDEGSAPSLMQQVVQHKRPHIWPFLQQSRVLSVPYTSFGALALSAMSDLHQGALFPRTGPLQEASAGVTDSVMHRQNIAESKRSRRADTHGIQKIVELLPSLAPFPIDRAAGK